MIHPMNKKAGPPQRPGQWKIAFSCSKYLLRDTLAIFAYRFLLLVGRKFRKWAQKVKPVGVNVQPSGCVVNLTDVPERQHFRDRFVIFESFYELS